MTSGGDDTPTPKKAKRGPAKKEAYVSVENIAIAFILSDNWKVQPAVRAAVDIVIRGQASAFWDGRPAHVIDAEELTFNFNSDKGGRAEPSARYLEKAKDWRQNSEYSGAPDLPPQTQYTLSPLDSVIRYLSSEVRKRLRTKLM